MKLIRTKFWMVSVVAAATMFTAGCASHTYYVAAPPSPPQGPPPLVSEAEHNGFRAGVDDGARDAYNGFGYRPKHDRNFHDTPGYDPRFGPLGPYQGYFRSAYLRGYSKGFYHQ